MKENTSTNFQNVTELHFGSLEAGNLTMRLVFLGTASCYPTAIRGVSCTALQFEDGSVWLFDCGEGTQIQLQKSSIKPGKICKIFITHLHGDHLFGLPGLICTLGNQVQERPSFKLEIFGPHGLRKFVRNTLSLSRSPLPFEFVVHELMPEAGQFPEDWEGWKVDHDCDEHPHLQEMSGRCISNVDLTWDVYEDSHVTVQAGPIDHRVPCFGYVVLGKEQPGKLDARRLVELGVKPGPLYAKIKNGATVTLEDGTIIHPSQVIGPPKRGRKIVILGDTNNPLKMVDISRDCDVLIHEATLQNDLQSTAVENGHSTPEMAVKFARAVNAKVLILNHFSQRYKPAAQEPEEEGCCVTTLYSEAVKCMGDSSCKVVIAEDLMEFPVAR